MPKKILMTKKIALRSTMLALALLATILLSVGSLPAGYGEPSTLTLVTKSGKEIPISQWSQADQVEAAMAFEPMRNETR
jgi:hypothetical protein